LAADDVISAAKEEPNSVLGFRIWDQSGWRVPCMRFAGGRVLLYGVHEHAVDHFDVNQIVLKDLTAYGALSDRTGWEDVITLVAAGALNLKSLITHRFPLEEAPRAFEMVRTRREGLIEAESLRRSTCASQHEFRNY
jgi:hypothetical protein